MSPAERAAHSQAIARNLCWPPGSAVSVRVDDVTRVQTVTAGPAEVCQGEVMICVASTDDCPPGPWPLDRVRPVHAELTAAASWRGVV